MLLLTKITFFYKSIVDLKNFGVKKLRKAHTLMKLKHTRFFTMKILPSNNWYMHLPFIAHTCARQMYVIITYVGLKCVLRFIT